MLTYEQIAEMTGTSVDKVRSAVNLAEVIEIPEEHIDQRWDTL